MTRIRNSQNFSFTCCARMWAFERKMTLRLYKPHSMNILKYYEALLLKTTFAFCVTLWYNVAYILLFMQFSLRYPRWRYIYIQFQLKIAHYFQSTNIPPFFAIWIYVSDGMQDAQTFIALLHVLPASEHITCGNLFTHILFGF